MGIMDVILIGFIGAILGLTFYRIRKNQLRRKSEESFLLNSDDRGYHN